MKNKFFKISLILLLIMMVVTGCKVQTVDEFNKIEEDQIEDIENDREDVEEEDIEETEKVEEKTEEELEEEKSEDGEKENKEIKIKETQKEEVKDKLEKEKQKAEKKEEVEEVKENTVSKENKGKEAKKLSKNSEAKTETKPSSEANDNSKPAKDKKSEKPADKPNIPAETKKKYVTIEIRVDTILDNYDKLDAKLQSEKFVPSSGVILSKTKIELNEGENVFDILVKATRENRIHMEYQGAGENQYGSAYIQGINNVYEFSVGELSGWMYSVNDWYPNYGVSNYKLEDGDNISFNYTCDLGRDLGQKWVK